MVSLLAFILIVIILLAVVGEFSEMHKRDQRIKRIAESKKKLANAPKLTPQQQRERDRKSEEYRNLYGD